MCAYFDYHFLDSLKVFVFTVYQDKYRFDSERAELPARPVDVELEGTSLCVPLANHHGLNHSNSMLSSSQRSLCNSVHVSDTIQSFTSAHCENSSQVVKRDTVVKSFDLQPSVFENGKFQNPWRNYKAPTFTNILKLGFSRDKSKVSSKQVLVTSVGSVYNCNLLFVFAGIESFIASPHAKHTK